MSALDTLAVPPFPAPPAERRAPLNDPRSMLLDPDGVYYPESEENPMPGNDFSDRVGHHLKDTIEDHCLDQPGVYVAGDNFIYPVKGHPEICFSPDVYVVEGVEKRDRLWFKAFEEPPHRFLFAAEIASPRTVDRDTDADEKPATYAKHGFEEYFQIDPFGSLLRRRVQGFRLVNGTYAPLPTSTTGVVRSELLGLDLSFSGERLRVVNATTGQEYLPAIDARRRAEAERRRAETERLRADRGDEENARLRAEIEALRRKASRGP